MTELTETELNDIENALLAQIDSNTSRVADIQGYATPDEDVCEDLRSEIARMKMLVVRMKRETLFVGRPSVPGVDCQAHEAERSSRVSVCLQDQSIELGTGCRLGAQAGGIRITLEEPLLTRLVSVLADDARFHRKTACINRLKQLGQFLLGVTSAAADAERVSTALKSTEDSLDSASADIERSVRHE